MEQVLRCPTCGNELEKEDSFCSNCREETIADPEESPEQTPTQTPFQLGFWRDKENRSYVIGIVGIGLGLIASNRSPLWAFGGFFIGFLAMPKTRGLMLSTFASRIYDGGEVDVSANSRIEMIATYAIGVLGVVYALSGGLLTMAANGAGPIYILLGGFLGWISYNMQ